MSTKRENPLFHRIVRAAESARLSLAEMCDKAELNRTHVYRFKKPGTEAATRTLERIAGVTGVSVDWLISGQGEMFRDTPSDRYPNRARAMAKARDMQFSERAVLSVLDIDPGRDQRLAWWIQRIAAAETEIEGAGSIEGP